MANISLVQITGQVIDNASDTGEAGLTVEVWDSTQVVRQALATGKTDDNGRFMLRFDPLQFKMQEVPDLFFKVLDGDNLLTSTEDQVTWNSGSQEDVTIYLVAPEEETDEKDKYTGLQLLTVTNFVRQSDFKGLFSQVLSTAGTGLGFARDMFVGSLTDLERPPISVTTKREDILGQHVQVAARNLKDQEIAVDQVLPYKPRLDKASFSMLGSQPVNLRSGQTVNLYVQDDIVKYYSLSSSGSSTSSGGAGSTAGNAAGVPNAPGAGAPNAGAPGAGTPGVGAPTAADLAQLKEELNNSKTNAAQKDEQISKLQEELLSLRKDQNELKAFMQSKFPG